MTNVTETEVEGGYEQRYRCSLGTTEMEFVRRPVSIVPPEGTIAFVDDGPRFGSIRRQTAGCYQDGKWRRVNFEPSHWTHWA